jgi:hypothetical protein
MALGCAATVLTVAPSGRLHAATNARVSEPVILTGAQLASFVGAPVRDVRVRTMLGGNWTTVVAQVDERDSGVHFVSSEDGRLDANDVVVFMSDRLGEQAPVDSWPSNLSHEHSRFEVAASDPLDVAYHGYAYVFWATQTSPGLPGPLIQFDSATHEIKTSTYTLGLAGGSDGFIGMKSLSLFGGPNLVDRLKMRVSVNLFGLPTTYTEEDIGGLITAPRRDPLVSGPVRLLFDDTGTDVAYPARVSLFGSLGKGAGSLFAPVTSARLSLDLSPAAVPATYRDANVLGGVPIDGKPDAVPASPVPSWHEVRFGMGRLISAGAPAPAGSSLKLYYKDDAKVDSGDTGDKMSYGDTGVVSTKPEDASGPPPPMIFLAPDDPTTAEQVDAQVQQPLALTVREDVAAPTATETPEPSTPAAPTLTPTRTATRAPSPMPTPAPHPSAPLYLPIARRP